MVLEKEEIIQKYEEIAEQSKINSFKELFEEFELLDILRKHEFMPSNLLTFIRRVIVDKLSAWENYLHIFLMPQQQSMMLMHEYQNFDEKKREDLIEYIRQLMIITRGSIKLELVKNNKEEAKFINEAYNVWMKLKPELLKVAEINIDIWKKKVKKDDGRIPARH